MVAEDPELPNHILWSDEGIFKLNGHRDEDSSVRDHQLKTKDILYMLRHDLPELIGYYHGNDHICVDMAINKFTELG
uniref:PiggyBac transposable element-derived protein domain-containing protein n=1 Tax=Plectus sambesii TaxID=2011161 RepID=A0A914WTN6_9BILA